LLLSVTGHYINSGVPTGRLAGTNLEFAANPVLAAAIWIYRTQTRKWPPMKHNHKQTMIKEETQSPKSQLIAQ